MRLLTVVVQRRVGRKVAQAALDAGATGVTWHYAQGTGVRQGLGLLGLFIDAEKQVLLIVTPAAQLPAVQQAVVEAGRLLEPGQGFAFVQEVLDVVGFVGDAEGA